MTQQLINVGTLIGDNTGDPGRTAFQKINSNFGELYNGIGGAILLSAVAGTNTVTATSTTYTAYFTGSTVSFVAAGANTGATTLNINGLGAKAITKQGSTALTQGDIKLGQIVMLTYDGTRFQIIPSKIIPIASALDFGAVGNGVTDDTAAINLAIAALNAGTVKALYIPAGTYVLSSALTTITKDGVTIYGDGPRLSLLSQRSNVDALTFSNAVPATNRIADIFLSNFGIDYGGITAPTAGRALTLIRPGRSYISNVDIRSVYQGIDCQGGADTHISNITISGAYSWSVLAAGSFLLKFQQHTASLEVPSEVFINNFNIKGVSTYGGTDAYLSTAVVVAACDGLFFDTGHLGFSYNSQLFINPQAVASASLINLSFHNVYVDGNNNGAAAASGTLLSGSTVPAVAHISFIGCTFKNSKGNGFNAGQGNLTDLKIVGSEFSSNGAYGFIGNGGSNIIVSNNLLTLNNGNNSAADCITLVGVVGGVVTGNQVLSGTFAHAVGININVTCSDLVVQNNLVGSTHVLDFNCISVTRIQFGGNRKLGADPTVVSVDGFVLPLGYDVVTVTGNTNFGNIGNTIVPWNKITLRFTGTPTALDATGNIKLAGNFVAAADSTLTMMGVSSTVYTEVSRAIV